MRMQLAGTRAEYSFHVTPMPIAIFVIGDKMVSRCTHLERLGLSKLVPCVRDVKQTQAGRVWL